MGLSCSWIGVKGADKTAVLASLGLTETGRKGREATFRLAAAQLKTGWVIVEAQDLEFASPQRIAELSENGAAVGCLVEEHVMFSGVRYCERGREKWWALHDAQKGVYDLSTGGDLPPEFAAIRKRLIRSQDSEGGAGADVDFLMDAPVKLAATVTGYRADGGRGLEDPLRFELRPIRRPGPLGFLARLLGR